MDNPQTDIKKISDLINKLITPKVIFQINPYVENDKTFLSLSVNTEISTPYYYQHEGAKIAYNG